MRSLRSCDKLFDRLPIKKVEITIDGGTFCDEPPSAMNKRKKRIASGAVPLEKQRTYKKSTRWGFPFKICYSGKIRSFNRLHQR
jgi:hypothetical protein